MDWSKYTISLDSSVLDVLKQIDKTPDIQTVFVLNATKEVIGTITDGDIRRGLISGLTLEDSISKYLFRDFQYIAQGKDNFQKLKLFRDRKLKAIPLLSEDKRLVKIIDFTTAKSILPVDAVIMAGGKGSRLKPLTNDTPKPLLKVGEKEIISYNFDRLYQFGITRQYVSINYLGEQIDSFCRNYNENINFRMITENEYLGTAGALSLIDDFHNDTILLMNSDILTYIDASNHKMLNLFGCYDSLEEFCKITDNILEKVEWICEVEGDNVDNNLKLANKIYQRLKRRDLYKLEKEIFLSQKDSLDSLIEEYNLGKDNTKYCFALRKIGFTNNNLNPLFRVKFYNKDILLKKSDINGRIGTVLPKCFEERSLIIFKK